MSAGPDVEATLPDTRVRLEGTAPQGQVLWSQVSGPSQAVFENPTNAVTGAAADAPGKYVLRMTVRDPGGQTLGADDVEMTIRPNAVTLGANSTPLDQLRTYPRPAFREGHTLLPLTYSSCAVASPITEELVKHWGYAAQFSTSTETTQGLLQLVRESPNKYPIAYSQASLFGVFENLSGADPSLPILPPETYIRDAAGTVIREGGRPIVSPAAPDNAMRLVGQYMGQGIRATENAVGQRISFVLNNGEYGLFVWGDRDPKQYWGQDPRVLQDMTAQGFNPDNIDDWVVYFSRSKARQERLVKETAYAALARGRPSTYIWYQEAWGTQRGRWFGWRGFQFTFENYLDANGRPTNSDLASPEFYYRLNNEGWFGVQPAQLIPMDGLTQMLREAGGLKNIGQRNFYPFLSQGWEANNSSESGAISADDLYIGALKTFYTAGAVGAASGYFNCSPPYFDQMRSNAPAGATPHTQIRNFVNLAKVHALFTYLEPFLKQGTLLNGDGSHPYTGTSSPTTASMEFNVVGEAQPNQFGYRLRTARVVARKLDSADRWLVTAWANTGQDRDVRVTIDPGLGELVLRARRAGSVYVIERGERGQPVVRLVDPDAMNPTRELFPSTPAL